MSRFDGQAGGDHAARLGIEGMSALAGAYRRALTSRSAYAGSDHLLVETVSRLVVIDIELSGDRGTEAVPSESDDDLDATLREARWRGVRSLGPDEIEDWLARRSDWPQWSDEIRSTVRSGLLVAERNGAMNARAEHLLVASLEQGGSHARELVDRLALQASVTLALKRADSLSTDGSPSFVGMLESGGLVVGSASPRWVLRPLSRLLFRLLARTTGYGSPMLRIFQPEVVRQAVRTEHTSVTTAHLVLAVLSIDEQMSRAGVDFVKEVAPFNTAGRVLRDRGLALAAAAEITRGLRGEDEVYSREEAKRFIDGDRIADPIWGRRAGAVLDSAVADRRQRGDANAGTTHLLRAVLADRGCLGAELLLAAGLDLDQLAADLR